jgi:hypothetical protein
MTINELATITMLAALVSALAGLARQRALLRATLAPIQPRAWIGLAAAFAVFLALTAWLPPHSAWEPNNHGHDRMATAHLPGLLATTSGEEQHGKAWFVAIRLIRAALGYQIDVYGASTLLLGIGGFALFLSTRSLADRARRGPLTADPRADRVALGAAFALWFSPLAIKLAPAPTVFNASIACWWTLVALAELHGRLGDAATRWATIAAVVWTAQTHMEFLLLAPALAPALWVLRAPERLRALASRPGAVAVALGGLALVPHLAHLFELDALAQLRSPSNPDPSLRVVGLATRWALLSAALSLFVWVQRGPLAVRATWLEGAPGRAVILATLAVGLALQVEPGLQLHDHDSLWSVDRDNELTALVDPTWGPPVWTTALAVGVLIAVFRTPWIVVIGAPMGGMFLLVYVDKFDTFSTWLRGTLPLWAVLAMPAGAGFAAWAEALHARRGVGLLAVIVGAALLPWVGPIAHPTDVNQEQALLDAARALDGRGEVVHALLPSDQGAVPGPERFDWNYFRGYVDAHLRTPDALDEVTPSLTDLLALEPPEACGRYVMLGVGCARLVWSGQPTDISRAHLVALGDRAYETPPNVAWAKVWRTRPDLPSSMARTVPCWDQPERQICAEPDATAREGCRTWTCSAGPAGAHGPWTEPLCESVRARFVLDPILEMTLSDWTANTYRMDPVAPKATLGLYRVACPSTPLSAP